MNASINAQRAAATDWAASARQLADNFAKKGNDRAADAWNGAARAADAWSLALGRAARLSLPTSPKACDAV